MTNATPTPAQRRLLLTLVAGGGTGYAGDLAKVITVRACRANGWIERLPSDPYAVPKHTITTAGRAIVAAKPRSIAERAKIAQGGRRANAKKRRLDVAAAMLEAAGWLPLRPLEIAKLSGASDAYVASYLRTSIKTRVEQPTEGGTSGSTQQNPELIR